MKLIKLNINHAFRSLQKGFEMEFHQYNPEEPDASNLSLFHPFCFAGLNASGKSNVLEALASIFYHLDCCSTKEDKPESFKTVSYTHLDVYKRQV